MPHRFYAPDGLIEGAVTELPREETDHLRRVLRLRAGDAIRVFDGRGAEFAAHVEALAGARATVAVDRAVVPGPETRTRIRLVQSVLKGDKMDEVVRDSVMLGVSWIQPVLTARTEMSAAAARARVERWRRIALASTKQCGRAYLAEVGMPCPLDEWMPRPRDVVALMLVEPGADAPRVRRVQDVPPDAPESASVVVGPEGGWTREELQGAAAAGITPVTLGPRTLRAEAVPLVALSMLLYAWDQK